MANHKSAKKRVLQTAVKTERNKAKKSAMRSVVKDIRIAFKKNDKETATELLPKAQEMLDKLAKKGIIKKNTAARRTSRLAAQTAKL